MTKYNIKIEFNESYCATVKTNNEDDAKAAAILYFLSYLDNLGTSEKIECMTIIVEEIDE